MRNSMRYRFIRPRPDFMSGPSAHALSAEVEQAGRLINAGRAFRAAVFEIASALTPQHWKKSEPALVSAVDGAGSTMLFSVVAAA
jgi:hypothetical protein